MSFLIMKLAKTIFEKMGNFLLKPSGHTACSCHLKARLHWRFYLDENVSVLATVSMFVVMDVYDSHGKQIHQPWDTLGRCGLKNRKILFFQNVTPKVRS